MSKHSIDVTYEREDDDVILALAKSLAEKIVRWHSLTVIDDPASGQYFVDAQNYLKVIAVPEDGIEVRIHYTFYAGQPEQGPSYASGGQPAEPASVEFDRAEILEGGTIDAADLDLWATTILYGRCQDWAIETACVDNEPDPDAMRDAREDRRQMERDMPSNWGDEC